MLFEYDEHKNELNIEKYKVSFEEARGDHSPDIGT